MKMMKTKLIKAAICLCMVLVGCTGTGQKNDNGNSTPSGEPVSKPLNISIYIDLSDRIKQSQQVERDLAIVDYLTDYFRQETLTPKILKSKNNMKVFFSPAPDSPDISMLADSLCVDITKYQGVEKKNTLLAMKTRFHTNLQSIYEKTIKQGKWVGCDIWDFFSNKDVDRLCIRSGFRNILVILTDGYLYHKGDMLKEGNAYSYVLPQTLENPNSSLFVKRTGLDSLEVRILEINPKDIKKQPKMVEVLENWLKGMGVKAENITVYHTDLPTHTRTVIENFLR